MKQKRVTYFTIFNKVWFSHHIDQKTLIKKPIFAQLIKIMRLLLVFLVVFAMGTSCVSNSSDYAKSHKDTLQTESGIRYIYLTRGDGQKVEEGSFVKAMLSLTVEDSVIWTTYDSPDSLYSFIVGHDSVISGFKEMALLMREGDNVYVSIPDSLAYGERGAGNGIIPPYSTIIYDRYELVSVSAPKKIITDTLTTVFLDKGGKEMQLVFESLTEAGEDSEYHLNLLLMQPIFNRLLNASEFQVLNDILLQINDTEWEMNEYMYGLYDVLATEGIGDINGAIAKTEAILEKDSTQFLFRNKLVDLESKKSPKKE